MLYFRLIPAACAASLAVSALAAPAATKPDLATVAEAVRLLDTDGFDEDAVRSTELITGVQLAAMVDQLQKQFGDTVPADFVDQLRTTVHDHVLGTFKAHLAEMKQQAAEIYAQQFTKAELVHLRELHADPVAVKARERARVMQPQLMKIGVTTMQAAEPELDARIKRLVSDYLAAHGKSPASSS